MGTFETLAIRDGVVVLWPTLPAANFSVVVALAIFMAMAAPGIRIAGRIEEHVAHHSASAVGTGSRQQKVQDESLHGEPWYQADVE